MQIHEVWVIAAAANTGCHAGSCGWSFVRLCQIVSECGVSALLLQAGTAVMRTSPSAAACAVTAGGSLPAGPMRAGRLHPLWQRSVPARTELHQQRVLCSHCHPVRHVLLQPGAGLSGGAVCCCRLHRVRQQHLWAHTAVCGRGVLCSRGAQLWRALLCQRRRVACRTSSASHRAAACAGALCVRSPRVCAGGQACCDAGAVACGGEVGRHTSLTAAAAAAVAALFKSNEPRLNSCSENLSAAV